MMLSEQELLILSNFMYSDVSANSEGKRYRYTRQIYC